MAKLIITQHFQLQAKCQGLISSANSLANIKRPALVLLLGN